MFMKKMKFNVDGMRCTSCEMLINDSLKEIGVKKSKVNHKKGLVIAVFDDSKLKEDEIVKLIEKEGYKVKQ